MRLLVLALQLQQAVPDPGMADSATRARIDSVTHAFFKEWRNAWMDTQADRSDWPDGFTGRDASERLGYLHCHFGDGGSREGLPPRKALRDRQIVGETRSHASCPTWYPPGAKTPDDERRSIDHGLAPAKRPRIRRLRDDLRRLLDSASLRFPRDAHLAGQRVRFALDAGDARGVLTAACAGDVVQCALLQGLALHRLGLAAAADSAFADAGRRMTSPVRCAWTDVSALLDADARARYARLECADRAAFEDRLWWLADPLWLERGNERRAEHLARRVHLSLTAALGVDERQHYLPHKGGEAVAETLIRYGWPTQMYWVAQRQSTNHQTGHDEWLANNGAEEAQPYVTREYSWGRLHVVPAAERLADPFSPGHGGWQLVAPDRDDDWWPREHYARDAGRIVPLVDAQLAMLRRRDATRIAWATRLDARSLRRANGETVRATLFESRTVGAVDSIESSTARVGGTLVVDAMVAPGRALLGVEFGGDTTRAAGRARFGVLVDSTLAMLGDRRSLSAPLLFDPPEHSTGALDADGAIARMYGSTTFERTHRVGVYWESYGFTVRDSVQIELHVSREDRPGVFERVRGMLRLGGGRGNEVGMRWREVSGASRARQLDEGATVQMRSIVLEISRLQRGTYRLQVAMNRPGEPAVTSERAFVIR